MNRQSLIMIITVLALIAAFQNCSKVAFSASTGTLTKVTDDGAANAQNLPVVPDSEDGISPEDVIGELPPESPDYDSEEPDSEVADGAKNKYPEQAGNESADGEDDEEDSDGSGKYICILEGSGKSIRLGYSGGGLVEIGQTPKVVCMSQNACLNIVSQKFSVKGPEERGFCPNKNPHVIHLTDSQLSDLL